MAHCHLSFFAHTENPAESEDYMITSEETINLFNSSCLNILNVLDAVIEDLESYEVFLNSTDEAVSFLNDQVLVTIFDNNPGKCKAT